MLEYREVLDALNELRESSEITHAVHRKAVDCLDKWNRTNFSMPKIWHHGPDSVVFEWSNIQSGWTHTLTVSAHGYGLMTSSPRQIEWRLDLP